MVSLVYAAFHCFILYSVPYSDTHTGDNTTVSSGFVGIIVENMFKLEGTFCSDSVYGIVYMASRHALLLVVW